MLELNTNYREHMAHRIYAVIGVMTLLFTLLLLLQGQILLGLYVGFIAALSLTNAIYFHLHQRFLINPIVVSIFYVVANVGGLATMGVKVVFWAYPTILALYWIHNRKVAQQIVPLFYVAVCTASYLWLPTELTLRISASLMMLGFFFHIASGFFEQQFQDVMRLTITDHLTGAYNRRFMDSKIDELIERRNRFGASASLISLDVDHFKTINDHFGHSSGDKVLVEIVKLLQARVRVLDKICRSGGEEFVILLTDTEEQDAYRLAEAIRRAISESNFLNQSKVTISCGVAALTIGDSRDTWLKRADKALYQAKQSGRNRVVLESRDPNFPKDVFA